MIKNSMQAILKINKIKFIAFGAMLIYVAAIAIGAVHYLPYQTYAIGIFREYSINRLEYLWLILVAIFCTHLIPKKIDLPSDWFLIIFNVFLLTPGLTLGVASADLSFSKKLIVLPALIVTILIIARAKKFGIKKQLNSEVNKIRKTILYASFSIWVAFFSLLVIRYYGSMQFASLDMIYEQRELTGDVRGLWGYLQLYFTYVFSTLLVAYGLSTKQWRYFFIGSAGYLVMYLITAEKSLFLFPSFFLAIYFILNNEINPRKFVAIAVTFFSCIIFGVIFLADRVAFFDWAGFYLFTRLIATPSQFILDYYDFFSTNGYTFFSQIRGFDLLIDAPVVYASNPKWPQLGWIVGAGMHGVESNSNATFIASDGASSLGAFGMILMASLLCIYLVVINRLCWKFPKPFWSVIFAQQAFVLVSGSLFSLMLSFGGFLYLVLFILYRPMPVTRVQMENR